ncbi:protein FAR-RED IMPAIRED RESPONSE 1-like [Rhododendron vialii]|uniref:protein FAR-RED IMPAIRED RESPONSE 1-like n=1 Tax=Rhododendron vialii TaxID=182163 RepID=UPI00265DDCEF|nr:protein FAR-RED IMPAIRED RESPONSE 1-like [Rhododendron vialii]
MSSDSVALVMPPNKECVEEEEVWSEDCDEIDTSRVGKEATENCEDGVEEPKEGMTFDTSEEAYSYYSRYTKEKGFAVAKRSSRKGKDGKLKDVTIACSHAGKIEAGGPGKLPYIQKNCRNHVDKVRRSLLMEGDAQAMHNYFMKMKADNSNFFFAMDLDDEGRLRNVFWADARSMTACQEFGDIVTFDTSYLVNRHDMPFAPFVGVNHHGQSVLLGCGLISHEDTESFSRLFQTWKTSMWGCAPKAIIIDQCMAMKNAIEDIFPNTRHRAVYTSLTIKQFEDAWDVFIKKYKLQSNTWLEGLYLERKQWVPAYLNDVFWAGMSSTQRSKNINAYFDGYIHSKTTLKQFVGQYENALGNKVESENQADVKIWNTFIPLTTEDELEKQFQSVYTHAKVKEF